jgi:hypothetical protein
MRSRAMRNLTARLIYFYEQDGKLRLVFEPVASEE